MLHISVFISVALFSTAQSTDLALRFNANNSTCSAACSTCDNKETLDSRASQDIQQLINSTQNNTQAINDIVISLSHIRNSTTSNAGAINNLLLLVERILQLQNNGSSISPIPTSCQEIKNKQPNSPSGWYLLATINSSNIYTNYVYCQLETYICNSTGWRRVAHFDMRNNNETCPSGFRLYSSSGVRACGRPISASNTGSCVGTVIMSNDIPYSEVCGRVIGYQKGWTDASNTQQGNDNVILTYGNDRKLIWRFLAGTCKNGYSNCPCGDSTGLPYGSVGSVGTDYYCEAGSTECSPMHATFYSNERLWDGEGCGSRETQCCERPGMPWFHKLLGNSTTDNIELRVCLNSPTSDEDIAVEQYEIYVK